MKKIVLIILFLVFVLTGCSIGKTQESNSQETDSQKQLLQPKQVIENYFKYYTKRNKEGIRLTRTDSEDFEFDENIEYMKLDSISETFNPSFKEAYMKYGRGTINGATEENIRVFKIIYTVKCKKDGIGPIDSGKLYKWATFIRKDKNSPWLLDEIGEG